MNDTSRLLHLDRKHVWHPCTQHSDHEFLPMLPIVRAQGAYLFDADGKRYIDAISSWWTCLLGHSHPKIVEAIQQQAVQLDHVIFGGCTHPSAIELAQKLCELSGLDKAFYADIGSAAVEVALKMSFHYFQNRGQANKTRFVCLSNSYHGETLGALSVTDVALYRKTYGPILLEPIITPSADAFLAEPGESAIQVAERQALALQHLLEARHSEICALIIEPLVQCAGGMRMYHPHYLARAAALCQRFEVHLIADEIATGFGRTGSLFACQQAHVTPDFLLLGKGLTGGSIALSVVLTRDSIYEAFYAPYAELKAFLHSHSFTGNPIATAAALACVKAIESEKWVQKNLHTAELMRKALEPFSQHPNVAEVRQTGMIAAIELVQSKNPRQNFPWQDRRGLRVYQHGLQHGALLRPLGHVIYLMPPFCISEEDLDQLAGVIETGIAVAVA